MTNEPSREATPELREKAKAYAAKRWNVTSLGPETQARIHTVAVEAYMDGAEAALAESRARIEVLRRALERIEGMTALEGERYPSGARVADVARDALDYRLLRGERDA